MRPYICRLSILLQLTWPSTAPELQGRLSPAVDGAVELAVAGAGQPVPVRLPDHTGRGVVPLCRA